MERWPSGLRHLLGEQANVKAFRRFKSCPFRHLRTKLLNLFIDFPFENFILK